MFSGAMIPRFVMAWCASALLVVSLGCGGGTSDPAGGGASRTSPERKQDDGAVTPPVAAIAAESANVQPETNSANVTPGSPEALLLEITRLVAAAHDGLPQQQSADPAGANGERADQADQQATPDDASAEAIQRQRLNRIVELATQVIAATHEHPDQERLFNNAVHYLSDARLELASAGDAVQAQLLIEDAESLLERDADSFAAAEAGFKVVELAGRMAESFGADDPDWIREYADQTVQFAQRFPEQEGRAAMTLFAAGRLCDRAGQPNEALRCLRLLGEQYAGSVFAEQSAGFLRRLTLPGQPIELSGPTIDGGFVDVDQYAGRVVLVVFWTSTSPTFQEQLPALRQVESRFASEGLAIIGVNLDVDEAAVDRFLTAHGISWPQVFSPDPNLRGGRNPVARYYSVQVVPAYWLVDKTGTVVDAPVGIVDLPQKVEEYLTDP